METVHAIDRRLGAGWAALAATEARTDELVSELREVLLDLEDSNYSIIVTGSLGRGEATVGSDADWILLVDGLSNPDHALLMREIERRIKKVVPAPVGATKTFGEIVPSHDLVHYIAGAKDSNANLTRRILLLSESKALCNELVRRRVILNLLARYVVYDRSVPSTSGGRHLIPHFLLNDIVRYWRTMASDYASKMWERDREGWGIRNIKLRFSRKLLFIWGLLASFSADLFPSAELASAQSDDEFYHLLADLIRQQTDVPPLELLARVVEQTRDDDIARDIFSSYNHFLTVLSDQNRRKDLISVRFEDATASGTYDELRKVSRTFRFAVDRLFFEVHPTLPRLIRQFGVF